MLQQDRLDPRMPLDQPDQFRAAIAAESGDADTSPLGIIIHRYE
jgi:hypothetical protein